ncbi:MAG: PA14 domain-containing protein, partial [Verrucomicrobiota bacterium]
AVGLTNQIDIGPRTSDREFALRFLGTLYIPNDGLWTFHLSSDDGSRLYIDGSDTPAVDNDGKHRLKTVSNTVQLAAGYYPVEVLYFQNEVGPSEVRLEYEGPGMERQEVSQDSYFNVFQKGVSTYTYDVDLLALAETYFDELTPASSSISNRIGFVKDSFDIVSSVTRFSGYINLPSSGVWTFYLGSTGDSRLYLNDDPEPLIENAGIGSMRELSASIEVGSASFYPIEVEYYNTTEQEQLQLEFEGPGLERKEITEDDLFTFPDDLE